MVIETSVVQSPLSFVNQIEATAQQQQNQLHALGNNKPAIPRHALDTFQYSIEPEKFLDGQPAKV